jgi:hypothetical protein
MKKTMYAGLFLVLFHVFADAQVLNTGTTLDPGSFSLSIAPVIFVEGHKKVGLFLGGGIGIARNADLGLKLRLFNDQRTYFGGDVEFALLSGMPSISLSVGAHAYHEVGLDGTLNITFPVHGSVSLYSGLDFDAEFYDGEQDFLLWVPVGIEVMTRRSLSMIMEIDIDAIDAWSMFALGLNIFF